MVYNLYALEYSEEFSQFYCLITAILVETTLFRLQFKVMYERNLVKDTSIAWGRLLAEQLSTVTTV